LVGWFAGWFGWLVWLLGVVGWFSWIGYFLFGWCGCFLVGLVGFLLLVWFLFWLVGLVGCLVGCLFLYISCKGMHNGIMPVMACHVLLLQQLDVCTKPKTHNQHAGTLASWYISWAFCTKFTDS